MSHNASGGHWWDMYDIVWHCMTIWYYMILYDTIWYYMILYDTIWYYMILYDTIWYYMILYDSICTVCLDAASPFVDGLAASCSQMLAKCEREINVLLSLWLGREASRARPKTMTMERMACYFPRFPSCIATDLGMSWSHCPTHPSELTWSQTHPVPRLGITLAWIRML